MVSHIGPPVMDGIELTEPQIENLREISTRREFFEYMNPHRVPVINGGNWIYDDYGECMEMCRAIETNNREHTLKSVFSDHAPGTFKPMRYR